MIYDGPDSNPSSIIAQYCNRTRHLFAKFFSSGRSLFVEVKTGHPSSPKMTMRYQMLDFQGNYIKLTFIELGQSSQPLRTVPVNTEIFLCCF